jgi:TDG/mug DNA glycosylase family protein
VPRTGAADGDGLDVAEATERSGRQPEPLAGADLWVVPNPSGLNAHETVATLATAYRAAAEAAGVL